MLKEVKTLETLCVHISTCYWRMFEDLATILENPSIKSVVSSGKRPKEDLNIFPFSYTSQNDPALARLLPILTYDRSQYVIMVGAFVSSQAYRLAGLLQSRRVITSYVTGCKTLRRWRSTSIPFSNRSKEPRQTRHRTSGLASLTLRRWSPTLLPKIPAKLASIPLRKPLLVPITLVKSRSSSRYASFFTPPHRSQGCAQTIVTPFSVRSLLLEGGNIGQVHSLLQAQPQLRKYVQCLAVQIHSRYLKNSRDPLAKILGWCTDLRYLMGNLSPSLRIEKNSWRNNPCFLTADVISRLPGPKLRVLRNIVLEKGKYPGSLWNRFEALQSLVIASAKEAVFDRKNIDPAALSNLERLGCSDLGSTCQYVLNQLECVCAVVPSHSPPRSRHGYVDSLSCARFRWGMRPRSAPPSSSNTVPRFSQPRRAHFLRICWAACPISSA